MNKQKRVNFLLQRTNRNQIQQNFHSFTMMVHCFCLWLSWLKFEFNQWILGLFLELTMLPWSKFSVVITVNWRYIMNCVLCTMNCISINFSDFIHFRAVCLFCISFAISRLCIDVMLGCTSVSVWMCMITTCTTWRPFIILWRWEPEIYPLPE